VKKLRKRRLPKAYSLFDELMASATNPLPLKNRLHQLTKMQQALMELETAPAPSTNDWRVLSDAVNLMETLLEMGHIEDHDGLLIDAITALAVAGKRHISGKPIRLDALGMNAVRAVLEDYTEVINTLPARTMIACHRLTEARLQEIISGKRRPHDVEIVDL